MTQGAQQAAAWAQPSQQQQMYQQQLGYLGNSGLGLGTTTVTTANTGLSYTTTASGSTSYRAGSLR